MDFEVSGGFLVDDNKNLLMIQEETGEWNVPSKVSDSGEITSDTALRAVTEVIKHDCEVHKYKSRMKTTYKEEEKEYAWQPYTVRITSEVTEIEVETVKEIEWVPVKEIKDKELAQPLEETADEIIKRV